MSRVSITRVAAGVPALLAAGASGLTYRRYRRDLRQARDRVSSGSLLIDTASGLIEYAATGEGPPVLVVHGAGGGFDQGLDLAASLIGRGYRVIAPSRFGYLRTPQPADPSPEAQADAHAALLDALAINRVPVIGVSAGGPSSMQLAIRHPHRVSALVLVVPLAYAPAIDAPAHSAAAPSRGSALAIRAMDAALRSDLLIWLGLRFAQRTMISMILATPPDLVATANPEEQRIAMETLDHMLPISARRGGLINDSAVATSMRRYPLETIAAPTLAMSAPDDGYRTLAGARYTAEHVPHGRLIEYPDGGHLLVGHQREASDAIAAFLRETAPQPASALPLETPELV